MEPEGERRVENLRLVPSAAALGFRAHSGWATLVAVAGSAARPVVVLRHRVELSQRTPRQPFHAAEHRSFRAAFALVERSRAEAGELALGALRDAMAQLRAQGHEAVASGLLLASGRPLPGLQDILASHSLIHAAEGELFREALRQASQASGLRLTEVKERDLEQAAALSLGRPTADLLREVAAWGRVLGPPWRQDEKGAALVGWLALSRAA